MREDFEFILVWLLSYMFVYVHTLSESLIFAAQMTNDEAKSQGKPGVDTELFILELN